MYNEDFYLLFVLFLKTFYSFMLEDNYTDYYF